MAWRFTIPKPSAIDFTSPLVFYIDKMFLLLKGQNLEIPKELLKDIFQDMDEI